MARGSQRSKLATWTGFWVFLKRMMAVCDRAILGMGIEYWFLERALGLVL